RMFSLMSSSCSKRRTGPAGLPAVIAVKPVQMIKQLPMGSAGRETFAQQSRRGGLKGDISVKAWPHPSRFQRGFGIEIEIAPACVYRFVRPGPAQAWLAVMRGDEIA